MGRLWTWGLTHKLMDADPKSPLQEGRSPAFHTAPCSRLITQAELENVLTHEGIVEYNAIEDPFGYDNGKTELAVSVAARVLDEIARGKIENGSCDWEENEDGWWNTDCGNAFEFTDGSPIYNEFKCCPYCGKTLTETPYSEYDDSSANSD